MRDCFLSLRYNLNTIISIVTKKFFLQNLVVNSRNNFRNLFFVEYTWYARLIIVVIIIEIIIFLIIFNTYYERFYIKFTIFCNFESSFLIKFSLSRVRNLEIYNSKEIDSYIVDGGQGSRRIVSCVKFSCTIFMIGTFIYYRLEILSTLLHARYHSSSGSPYTLLLSFLFAL